MRRSSSTENDPVRAEVTLKKAIELNPHDTASQARYIDVLRVTGRSEEALRVNARAVAAEPASPRLWAQRSTILHDLEQYEEAFKAAERAMALPGCNGNLRAVWAKGLALESLGRFGEAESVYRSGINPGADRWNLPSLGHLLGRMGRRDEALQVLANLVKEHEAGRPASYQIALVYTGLGEHDKALEWIERGRARNESSMSFLALEKRFRPLTGKLHV